MRIIFRVLLILLLPILIANCQGSSAQQTSSKSIEVSTQIDSLVNSYYHANEFSGSVLVAEQGKVLINKEYGYLGLDSTKEINSESVFEIASLSKQFTALLVMMLKEEQKLDYEDKIM